jgi:PadR family transcriptional regulator PadR
MAGSDLYVGTLDVLILKSLSWGPMHGYGIGRWIRQTTEDGLTVQEGALYPALHRLQRRGWLEEEWGVTETGREAKYYRLTPAGRRQLRHEVARWRAYARAVSTALDAAPA